MRKLLLVLPILCLPLTAAPKSGAAPKNGVAVKKPAAKSQVSKAQGASKAPAKSKTTKASAKSKKSTKSSKKTPARSTQQQHPTTERYTEIQQALVERGYLTEANGNWDSASIAAMKKFQEDQRLNADGKLSALSLTALGLGPRRGAFVVAPTPNAGSTVAAVE